MVIEEDLLTGGGGFGVFIELLRVIGAPVCLDTGIPTTISGMLLIYSHHSINVTQNMLLNLIILI